MTKAAELGTLYNAARLLDKARAERDEADDKLAAIQHYIEVETTDVSSAMLIRARIRAIIYGWRA